MAFHTAGLLRLPTLVSNGQVIPPANDPLLGSWSGAYVAPEPLNKVRAVVPYLDPALPWALATSGTDPQSWRPLKPINNAGFGFEVVTSLDWFFEPYVFDSFADFKVFNPSSSVNNGGFVLAILGDTGTPADLPPGRILHAHFTGTMQARVDQWNPTTLVFDGALLQGLYAVIGGIVNGSGLVGFRLVPSDGPLFRPGAVARDTPDVFTPAWQRNGGLGMWLIFDSKHPPGLEVLQNGSSVVPIDGVLDLIQLSCDLATPIAVEPMPATPTPIPLEQMSLGRSRKRHKRQRRVPII